jgi:hypothetical protein
MIMSKDGVERDVSADQLSKYVAAGWTVATKEQAKEEIIRLKPAVNNKATATALGEATNKGDE